MLSKLFVYDRKAGRTVFTEDFTDSQEALNARMGLERSYRQNPPPNVNDLEIVVLNGDSVASMRRTHGKYFGGLES